MGPLPAESPRTDNEFCYDVAKYVFIQKVKIFMLDNRNNTKGVRIMLDK